MFYAPNDEINKKPDAISPAHYSRFAIEPMEFSVANKLDWFQANAVKYIVRHDAKGGAEDIRKAINYLTKYVAYLEGDKNWMKAGS